MNYLVNSYMNWYERVKILSMRKESSNRLHMHSWLNEKGIFYPVQSSHSVSAANIVQDLGIPVNGNAVLALMKLGWMRVTFEGTALYANNPFNSLNTIQKRELIDLAIENKMQKIIFDNDEDISTIWSNDNQM